MFTIQIDHDTHPRVLHAAVALITTMLGDRAQQSVVIPQADRPDAGTVYPPTPVPPPVPASWPQAPIMTPPPLVGQQIPAWGGAPQQPPLPPPAPSTAAAPQWPTAPGAPTGFLAPQAPAASLPVPQFVPQAAAPAAATTQPPAGIALDAAGLPWDGRIHSSGKSKLDNGTWKMKKGVSNDPAFVGRIESELRHVMGLQVPPAPQAQAPQQQPPTTAPQTPAAQQWQQQQPAPAPQPPAPPQWQQQPPAPQEPAPQAPQNISGPQTFPEFTAAVAAAISAGQFGPQRLMEVMTSLGLPSAPMLQHRPELVPVAWGKLTGQIA